ncbi:hypothetical protein BKA70DRAFT_1225265 [Coprinopsis sp. MPI-PUGE-AT-0042]|nr:hypothetical protein BKA70DRAFT_1225265 [Coprinopsis sp. MPI-PUGE-AT-0042]
MPRAKRQTNIFEALDNNPGQSSPEPSSPPSDPKLVTSPYSRPKGKAKAKLPLDGIAPGSIKLYLRSTTGKPSKVPKAFTLPGSYASIVTGESRTSPKASPSQRIAKRPGEVGGEFTVSENPMKKANTSETPAHNVQMDDATANQSDEEPAVTPPRTTASPIQAIVEDAESTGTGDKNRAANELGDFTSTTGSTLVAPTAAPTPAPTPAVQVTGTPVHPLAPVAKAPVHPPALFLAAGTHTVTNMANEPLSSLPPRTSSRNPSTPNKGKLGGTNTAPGYYSDNGFPYDNDSSDSEELEDDEDKDTPYVPLGLTYLHDFDREAVEINDTRVWEGVPEHKKIAWSHIPGEKMVAWCGYAKPSTQWMVRNERIIDGAYYLTGAHNIEIRNTEVDGGIEGNPLYRQLQPHLITGLTADQAQALEDAEYAVTADSFVIYKPFVVPNPSFVAAIPGIPLRNDNPNHKTIFRNAFLAALHSVRTHGMGFLNVHHDRMPDHIPAGHRYGCLLNTLEVEAVETSKNGKDAVAWIAYLNPPTKDTEAWATFSAGIKRLPIVIGDHPYYAYPNDYHCSGCHAQNHPSSKCPFRNIAGYKMGTFPISNSITSNNSHTSTIPSPADNIFLTHRPNTSPANPAPNPTSTPSRNFDNGNTQAATNNLPPPMGHPRSPGPSRSLVNQGRGGHGRGRGHGRGM